MQGGDVPCTDNNGEVYMKSDDTPCVDNNGEIYMKSGNTPLSLIHISDNETAEYVVKTILNSPFVELITPFYHFNLITVDPDDNKFVDCAISALSLIHIYFSN